SRVASASGRWGWPSGCAPIPTAMPQPAAASASSSSRAPGRSPAGCAASPAITNTSPTPASVSRARPSRTSAAPRSVRAARWGIARSPCRASSPATVSVASSPWVGEAVTVTRAPGGSSATTWSAMPRRGMTSNCTARSCAAGRGPGPGAGDCAISGPGAARGSCAGCGAVARGLLLRRVDERLRHHYRVDRLEVRGQVGAGALADVDREAGADLREGGRHQREADVLLQTGGVAGRGDLADRLAVVEDGEGVDHRPVVVGAQGVPAELEAHQPARRSLGLDAAQRLLAEEVRLLLEVD